MFGAVPRRFPGGYWPLHTHCGNWQAGVESGCMNFGFCVNLSLVIDCFGLWPSFRRCGCHLVLDVANGRVFSNKNVVFRDREVLHELLFLPHVVARRKGNAGGLSSTTRFLRSSSSALSRDRLVKECVNFAELAFCAAQ